MHIMGTSRHVVAGSECLSVTISFLQDDACLSADGALLLRVYTYFCNSVLFRAVALCTYMNTARLL